MDQTEAVMDESEIVIGQSAMNRSLTKTECGPEVRPLEVELETKHQGTVNETQGDFSVLLVK